MLTISDIKKTKNSVNPMNRFSQLQSAGQSYRPGGRRQEFATKLAFGANLAENTKLTETPLCPLCPEFTLDVSSLDFLSGVAIFKSFYPVQFLRVFVPLCLNAFVDMPFFLYICRESSTNRPFYAKQTQFTKCPKTINFLYNNDLYNFYQSDKSQKQTQFKPNQTQSPKSQNEYKVIYNKGLQKKR